TLRLHRRSAFSKDSPSCNRISATLTLHLSVRTSHHQSIHPQLTCLHESLADPVIRVKSSTASSSFGARLNNAACAAACSCSSAISSRLLRSAFSCFRWLLRSALSRCLCCRVCSFWRFVKVDRPLGIPSSKPPVSIFASSHASVRNNHQRGSRGCRG